MQNNNLLHRTVYLAVCLAVFYFSTPEVHFTRLIGQETTLILPHTLAVFAQFVSFIGICLIVLLAMIAPNKELSHGVIILFGTGALLDALLKLFNAWVDTWMYIIFVPVIMAAWETRKK